jgi:hypothetical protein
VNLHENAAQLNPPNSDSAQSISPETQVILQPTHPATSPTETPRYLFLERDPAMQLTFEQKDFICKHIAAFKSYKHVAELFLQEFPDSGLSFDQVLKRIKYYTCDNRTRKWRFRIFAYRNQLNCNLLNRFAIANPYQRLRHLEALFHQALQPRVRQVFWYPARRAKDDKLTYRAIKIRQPDFASAAKILSLIYKELQLDPVRLEPVDDPYMVNRRYRDPQAFAHESEAFLSHDPDADRDLDKTFGAI